ncbi:MAG: hypothetical protein K0R98_730 [Rickettsiaceae bacterium]|jgi:hypothetical protein|nr:hypothetical protein [Rickettsiaceae bacterium]
MSDLNNVPEVKLWCAVIKNALFDAGISTSGGKLSYIPASLSKSEAQDRKRAIHFLTDDSGGWKASRKLVCSHAMICPERLRKSVLRILAQFNNNNGDKNDR